MFINFTQCMLSDITYYVIYMEKIDLRIIKTKKSIYNAFISLMSEKTFEEIKVSEICERAAIVPSHATNASLCMFFRANSNNSSIILFRSASNFFCYN